MFGMLEGNKKIMDLPIAGVKYDEDKLDFTLLPYDGIIKVVETLMYGARKYPEAHNWLKVEDGKNRYIKALLRHAMQAVDEDLDSESGLPHLAHAACCCLFALHFMSDSIDKSEPVHGKKKYLGMCLMCGRLRKECVCPVN